MSFFGATDAGNIIGACVSAFVEGSDKWAFTGLIGLTLKNVFGDDVAELIGSLRLILVSRQRPKTFYRSIVPAIVSEVKMFDDLLTIASTCFSKGSARRFIL